MCLQNVSAACSDNKQAGVCLWMATMRFFSCTLYSFGVIELLISKDRRLEPFTFYICVLLAQCESAPVSLDDHLLVGRWAASVVQTVAAWFVGFIFSFKDNENRGGGSYSDQRQLLWGQATVVFADLSEGSCAGLGSVWRTAG